MTEENLEQIQDEKLIITIDEEEPKEEWKGKKFNELNVLMNTGVKAKTEYITEKIQGELDSIIISCNELINIRINLEDYPELVIFEKAGYTGTKCLSLRNGVTYSNNEKSDTSTARWLLNDELKISIDGNFETQVKIVIRWC